MKVRFKKVKETKNKIRFDEECEGTNRPIIGALYVIKEAVKDSTKVVLDITFID